MASQKKTHDKLLKKVAAAPLPPGPTGKTGMVLHVVGAKPGTTIEIAPGKTYAPLPAENVQTIGIVELVPAGDGTFRAVIRVCPRYFRCSPRDLERLNIPVAEETMRRLVRAGFVRGELVTPALLQFDYISYLEHLRRLREDPEFWDQTEPGKKFTNRQRYRQAL